MLVHIYLPKPMLALRVIKLMNALQFTLLCRMWAQHSKIYRIWPAFCGICIWRSPRLNDGSSRRYQKLGHDWHFEALFEKKGSHFFSNNKTRSSTCLRFELSGQWMTLLIFILVPTIPSWLFNTGNWMPEKENQTAWVTVILKKWGQLAEVTRIPGRNLA